MTEQEARDLVARIQQELVVGRDFSTIYRATDDDVRWAVVLIPRDNYADEEWNFSVGEAYPEDEWFLSVQDYEEFKQSLAEEDPLDSE